MVRSWARREIRPAPSFDARPRARFVPNVSRSPARAVSRARSPRRRVLRLEPVPEPVRRDEEARPRRVGLDLLPQPRDVVVERARRVAARDAPEILQDL